MEQTARRIRVTGQAQMSVKPDTTVLTLTLSEVRREYEEATELSADLTQKVRECVAEAGFDADSLKTTNFYVRPEYRLESSTERETLLKKKTTSENVFVGYRFHHSMELKFPNDNKRLGAVITGLNRANLGVSYDFGFTLSDPEHARREVLKEAARISRANAEALAQASGAELGEVLEINYSWGELDVCLKSPEIMYEASAPLGAKALNFDITPDDIDFDEEVTITWALK